MLISQFKLLNGKGTPSVSNDLKKVNLQSYSGSVCSGSPFRMWGTPVCVYRECARHVHRRDTQDHSHELHRATTLRPPTSEQLLLCSRKPATFQILNTLNLLNYPCKQKQTMQIAQVHNAFMHHSNMQSALKSHLGFFYCLLFKTWYKLC